jgi:FkbM family methyltransferase
MTVELSAGQRIRKFAARPAREKYVQLALRFRHIFTNLPIPIRLRFGSWFLAGTSWVDRSILLGGIEPAELLFVEKYLQPGMTVLDIGAHHGLYTLLASRRVGRGGVVVAFEPSPRERRQLLRNVKINFCSNACIEPCALGNEHSGGDLYVVTGGQDGCNSLRPPIALSETARVRVQIARLDDWIEANKLERVDFIKLDVEGGELDALKGADKLLGRKPRPVILAEVQDLRTEPWGYKAKEIIGYLVSREYKWFRIAADGSLEQLDVTAETFDGNFVAVPVEREAERFLNEGAGRR